MKKENIKAVKFISGIQSDKYDKEILQQGISPSHIVQHVTERAKESYDGNTRYLGDMIRDFNARLRGKDIDIQDLEILHLDILTAIDRLNDILHKTADYIPDAAVFVSEILVTGNDGKEYYVNQGMNDKISGIFKNAIDAITLKKAVVENKIKLILERKKNLTNGIQDKANALPGSENDYLASTIEDYLHPFRGLLSDYDYTALLTALKKYFADGDFPELKKKIKITGKVNKKAFGWELNLLYRSQKDDKLPREYLQFAKDNISIFEDVDNKNLYKYFTTKTPKPL